MNTKTAEIILLAAYTKNNRVIGNNGKIPWQLKTERDRFKQICSGKKVIMGRTTFEEIGHALPYCTIIILSKTMGKAPEGCLLAHSLEEAVGLCGDEVLVAGGETLYEKTIPFATKIYATEIYGDFEGNRFFPELTGNWKRRVEDIREENNVKFEYVMYEKLLTLQKADLL